MTLMLSGGGVAPVPLPQIFTEYSLINTKLRNISGDTTVSFRHSGAGLETTAWQTVFFRKKVRLVATFWETLEKRLRPLRARELNAPK